MGEPGRIQAFLGWWRELPTGWRVNVGLYVLAGVSLVALLTQVVVGGDSRPRRVEVAAGRQPPPRPTTTAVVPSTTELTTSTVPPLTTAPPATSKATATTRARAGSGGTGGATPSPDAATFEPPPPTAPACRNSRDPACGRFFWDPPAGDNAGLDINVAGPQTAKANEEIQFSVTVTDPDHVVTGNCTEISGAVGEGFPCNPPDCPPAYGPWTPPPRHSGSRTFQFTARFGAPGSNDVVFTFRTDRDGCPDPYGSVASKRVTVEVLPAEG